MKAHTFALLLIFAVLCCGIQQVLHHDKLDGFVANEHINWTATTQDFNTTGTGHDTFADFVANEHIDWIADQGATNIHNNNLVNSGNWDTAYSERGSQIAGTLLDWDGSELDVNEANIDHDTLTNFLFAEHLSLPNTVANVLIDGDFGSKAITTTNTGRFDGGIGVRVVAGANFPLEVVDSGYGIMQTYGGVEVGFYVDGSAGWVGTKSNHPLSFFTNNSAELMVIGTDGNFDFKTGNFTNVGTIEGGTYNDAAISGFGSQVEISANAEADFWSSSGINFIVGQADGFILSGKANGATNRNLTVTGGNWTLDQDVSSGADSVFGDLTADTYDTLSIIPLGNYTYLSGDGIYNSGLTIAIPIYVGGDFSYGWSGTEHHKFGSSGQVEISDDGLITAVSYNAITLAVNDLVIDDTANNNSLTVSTDITLDANTQTGWETSLTHVTNNGTDHSLLGATPGTATASLALIVDANKDIDLDGGDITTTGDFYTGSTLYHTGDTDTYIAFFDNGYLFYAGGWDFQRIIKNPFGPSQMYINYNGDNIDCIIKGDTDQNLFFTDASTDRVGIGTATPSFPTHIIGNDGEPGASPSGNGTLFIGDNQTANNGGVLVGYHNGASGYGWFQSYGGLPLQLNPVGNDIIFNRDSGSAGFGTETPDVKLQVVGGLKVGDDNTNYASFATDGGLTFVGTAGLLFGEISAHSVLDTITITGSGEPNKVQITSFDTDGASNNTTPDHTNDHITITKEGLYMCVVSLHIESSGGGGADLFGASVYKNNGATEFNNVHAHRKLSGGGGDVGAASMSGIIDLAVSDTIEVWIWNEDSTDDIVIDDITMSLVQIGGT